MDTFDTFFKSELKKGFHEVKKQLKNEQKAFNKYDPSDFTKERLLNLENKVMQDYKEGRESESHLTKVAEINNTYLEKDQRTKQIEILQGRYKLVINDRQTMPRKIEKFACEPVAFHLHKRNDFL